MAKALSSKPDPEEDNQRPPRLLALVSLLMEGWMQHPATCTGSGEARGPERPDCPSRKVTAGM